MKQLILFFLAALTLGLPAFGQTVGPLLLTGTQCAPISTFDQTATVAIYVSGSWSGTIQPQGTIQGQPAFNVQVSPANSSTPQATITANGAYVAAVAGLTTFQICGSSITGTARVFLNGSQAELTGGAGGSSGGNLSGSLTPGLIPYATGPNALSDGSISDDGAGHVNVKAINGVAYSHKYAGATLDVRVNAAMTDCETGANGCTSHIVDSSGEGGAQTISAQINVGDGANAVTWILPSRCDWAVGISDGTSSAIKQFSLSNIIGRAPLLRCEIRNNSSTNGLFALYTNNGGGYYRASGMTLENKNVATASGATMLIPNGFDGTTYEDMEVLNYVTNGKGILIGNTGGPCCTVNLNRITVNNNYTGGIPLDIEANASGIANAVYITNSSIDHPAAGLPNIKINDSSSQHTSVVGLANIYEETGNADTTTAPNQITGVGSVFINGLEVKTETSAVTAPAVTIAGTVASGVSVRDLSYIAGTGTLTVPAIAVQNNITSTACPSTPCNVMTDSNHNSEGVLTSYTTNNSYSDNFVALGKLQGAWEALVEQASAPSGVAGQTINYTKTSDHRPAVKLNNGSELTYILSDQTIGIPGAVNITPVTVNANTTSDQTLQEIALSANYLNSLNQPFLIDASGINTVGAGTPTLTYKMKLCTVSGCGSGTVVTLYTMTTAATVTGTATPWRIKGSLITNAIGASGTLIPTGTLFQDIAAAAATAQNVYQDVNTGVVSSAIDLTAALFLDFTVATSTGSASNTFTQKTAMIEPQSNVANAGIVASAPFYITVPGGASAAATTLNRELLVGFYLPYQVTFSKLTYGVVAADNTGNLYDLGIRNSAGQLICDTGATAGTTFAPSTARFTLNCVQGTVIAQAGKYYVSYTGNATTATIGGTTAAMTFAVSSSTFVTSGGALSSSITPPADAWTTTVLPSISLRQ